MKAPVGYIIVPEEYRRSCIGCAFRDRENMKCLHPYKHQGNIGCASFNKIFKKDESRIRLALSKFADMFKLGTTKKVYA